MRVLSRGAGGAVEFLRAKVGRCSPRLTLLSNGHTPQKVRRLFRRVCNSLCPAGPFGEKLVPDNPYIHSHSHTSMYEDDAQATNASRKAMQRRSFTQRASFPEPYVNNGRKHFFRNRMALCLLAVACNWGTSLRVAKRLATGVIEVPSLDVVVDTCRTSFDITRDERARYSNCVESQMNECNSHLDDSIRNEDERIHELSKENGAIVDRMIEVANDCSRSYAAFRDKTEDWTTIGGRVPLHKAYPESSCTADDLHRFNQTLLGTQHVLAQQAQAIQVVDEYSQESTATVKRLTSDVSNLTLSINDLTEYIKARAAYDANYLDRKTQRLQDALYDILVAMDPSKLSPVNISDLLADINAAAVDLLACTSLDREARMSDGSRCQPNLASMVHDFSDDAKRKAQILIDALYEYRDRMVEYKNNVSTAYNVAKRFYSGAFNSCHKPLQSCLLPPPTLAFSITRRRQSIHRGIECLHG